jgi:hypothetical protein
MSLHARHINTLTEFGIGRFQRELQAAEAFSAFDGEIDWYVPYSIERLMEKLIAMPHTPHIDDGENDCSHTPYNCCVEKSIAVSPTSYGQQIKKKDVHLLTVAFNRHSSFSKKLRRNYIYLLQYDNYVVHISPNFKE